MSVSLLHAVPAPQSHPRCQHIPSIPQVSRPITLPHLRSRNDDSGLDAHIGHVRECQITAARLYLNIRPHSGELRRDSACHCVSITGVLGCNALLLFRWRVHYRVLLFHDDTSNRSHKNMRLAFRPLAVSLGMLTYVSEFATNLVILGPRPIFSA
jgi:hypothetical protein